MKIAIIGTRGIPNNYGGFEQFAEYLSLGLVKKGHSVSVYNSHDHIFQGNTWNGVDIIHKHDPEKSIGTAGQFVYDLNCILDARRRSFDIILNLGYTSSSVWGRLFPKKSVVITNMDGLEWKRTKYSQPVRRFLMYAEKLATRHSKVLVADSPGIKTYLWDKYRKESHFIPYGAHVFTGPDPKQLEAFRLKPYDYNLLIARMEPENNVEMILDGMNAATTSRPFLVIGNYQNPFGQYLANKFESNPNIVFLGPIYNIQVINNLRYFSSLYFHGHSVGGTNPSLLEAMASSALVAAHNNEFNRHVLNDDAFYFSSSEEVTALINRPAPKKDAAFVTANLKKIEQIYFWEKIINQYEALMHASL